MFEPSIPVDPQSTPSSKRRVGRLARLLLMAVMAALAAGGGYALLRQGAATAGDLPMAKTGSSSRKGAADDTRTTAEAASGARAAKSKEAAAPEYPLPQRIKVPDGILDGGRGWLNTSGDIQLKDLRGKVVLLDFWTYCCINCMHVLPDLAYLEEKYAEELVVIGVHSAKFDNEKDSENIRNAIVRYNIEHPVINDADMILWRKFGVRAWPTLLIIDAEGQACFMTSGEGKRELLDLVIGKLVDYHRATDTLDETPIRFDLEREKLPPGPLKYPGKVLADAESDRLYIADTNHNRIVVSTLTGRLVETIGDGAIGAQDGSYDEARFDHPQGMALVGETLYVADTENHLIRKVDLKAKTVSTLAGTGVQDRVRSQGGKLRETALNSPWALQEVGGVLYVAMAGPHQIWKHAIGSATIEVYAGTGREDITNGPLGDSAFAQPSGFATDGSFLYVCDSEGSAIRKVPVGGKGRVTTVAGPSDLPGGRSLFEFGDLDAVGKRARLQHPIGIAYQNGVLFVADSYNHKIRRIVLGKDVGEVSTWLGDGTAGDSLDPPRFDEPHGLSIAAGTLFIADTNNHRICTADLKSGRVAVLTIDGLQPPAPKKSTGGNDDPQTAVRLESQRVAPGKHLTFEIALTLPEGYKLNQLAPASWRLTADGDQSLIDAKHLDQRTASDAAEGRVRIQVPLANQSGSGTFQLALTYRYCRDGVGGLCKVASEVWQIPVEVVAGADKKVVSLSARTE